MKTIPAKCFIIMPFSTTIKNRTEEYWTEHYDKFLKPTIEKTSKIIVTRSKPVRGDIIKEIISNLISADIVVADLTDSNPNVFWELGIRQSFKHGTITIAQNGTKLPFDISNKGTLFYYPNNHIKNMKFQSNLTDAINDCIKNPTRPDSKILETITGKGSFYELIQEEEINRKIYALTSEYIKNLKIYIGLKKNIESNQKDPTNRLFSTQLFRLASIELLISYRYLKASKTFYKTAEQYFDHLNSLNNRLISWPTRPDAIEGWLLKVYNIKHFENFYIEISKAIEK